MRQKVGFTMVKASSIIIHETIYRSLRSKIMYGEIAPGKTFSIRGLANEFSVSMTPIRDATRRLVAEGALTMSASGRISAPQINYTRLEELLSIRLLLEPELCVRAFPRIHSALIERLSKINRLIEVTIEKEDPEGFLKRNIEFHKLFYLRAQAPAMLAILETVLLQLGPTMKSILNKKMHSVSVVNHHNLLSSLEDGNHEKLAEAIRADIKTDFEMFVN